MVDSTKSAAQLLEELRKERNELDSLIQALERRMGISAPKQISESDVDQEPGREIPSQPPLSTVSLQLGIFHNLSQAAAAEKLMRMSPHRALTTGEIMDAFRQAGMQLHQKNAPTILYTALKRSPKFERVGNKAWGLKEWYPERKKRVSKEQDSSSEESE